MQRMLRAATVLRGATALLCAKCVVGAARCLRITHGVHQARLSRQSRPHTAPPGDAREAQRESLLWRPALEGGQALGGGWHWRRRGMRVLRCMCARPTLPALHFFPKSLRLLSFHQSRGGSAGVEVKGVLGRRFGFWTGPFHPASTGMAVRVCVVPKCMSVCMCTCVCICISRSLSVRRFNTNNAESAATS